MRISDQCFWPRTSVRRSLVSVSLIYVHPLIIVCPSVHPSIYPSIHPSIHPSVHPSVCPSIQKEGKWGEEGGEGRKGGGRIWEGGCGWSDGWMDSSHLAPWPSFNSSPYPFLFLPVFPPLPLTLPTLSLFPPLQVNAQVCPILNDFQWFQHMALRSWLDGFPPLILYKRRSNTLWADTIHMENTCFHEVCWCIQKMIGFTWHRSSAAKYPCLWGMSPSVKWKCW